MGSRGENGARAMVSTARASRRASPEPSRVTSHAASARASSTTATGGPACFLSSASPARYQSRLEPATAPTEGKRAQRRAASTLPSAVKCAPDHASEAKSKLAPTTVVSAAWRKSSWYAPPIAWLPPKSAVWAAKEASKPAASAPGTFRRATAVFSRRGRGETLRPRRTEPAPLGGPHAGGYWSTERRPQP
jgi:hypothetical protein